MSRRDAALVLLLGVLVFMTGLGLNDLWNPDEPRYAQVAREMLLGGDLRAFLVPHLNGEVYTHKPPLLFWTICLSAGLLGELDEVAARLPTAISGVLTLLLLFDIGSRLLGRRAAWISVAVLATCVNIMMQARSAQIDMLLVLLVTLAMSFWVRGFVEDRPRFNWLFFAACGLATLAKGPVGLLPPLLSVIVFLLATRRTNGIGALRPLRGLGLWALVVLAWLVPAGIYGGEEYLRDILLRQNLERYANPWHHIRPFYYYLQILPSNFFPWFFLLPSAVVYGWRRIRDQRRDGFLFALCWMAVTIAFFSLSPGKRTVYILTMYPAMALLIGAAMDRLADDAKASRGWLGWPIGLLALVGSLVGAAVPVVTSRREELDVLGPAFSWWAVAAFAMFGLFAALSLWHAWKRRVMRAVTFVTVGSAVLGLLVVLVLRPPFDAFKSARGLSEILVEQAAPEEPYGIYPRLDFTFLFYTERHATELRTEEELRAFVDGPGRVWLLIERGDLEAIDPPLPMTEVARDDDALEGFVLLVSR